MKELPKMSKSSRDLVSQAALLLLALALTVAVIATAAYVTLTPYLGH